MNTPRVDRILLVFEQFLQAAELDFLRSYAIGMEQEFAQATTVQMGRPGTLDVARRRANVLTDVGTGEAGQFFKTKIEKTLPAVLESFELPILPARRISVQITSTGDGGFYKPHTDNSPQDSNRRVLSFVYFCNPYPGGFQGGDLRIYETREHKEIEKPGLQVHTITPYQNRIIFFKSDFVHEISKVVCPSNELTDTRLTVNGWIYFD